MHQQNQASVRPLWLLPALAVGAIGIGLVIAGVISATTLIYIGVIGGMLVMHLGHGGHGAHAGHGEPSPIATTSADSHATGSGPATGGEPKSHSCH